MTMFDLEFINQQVNLLYQNCITTLPQSETAEQTTLQSDTSVNHCETPIIPGPKGPGSEPSPLYYFLDQHIVPSNMNSPEQPTGPVSKLAAIRKDFPILAQKVNNKPLIWFDNAATTQKPFVTTETIRQFYHEYNSNVHRGAHTLATLATNAYENARKKVQQFIGANSSAEIIFLRGTTEAINLVAQTYGKANLGKGDEILLTMMEHHSNIVPWQILQKETDATIRVIPINNRGEIILSEYEKMLSRRTCIVAFTHVSNVLGTINPVRTMTEMAHHYGARVLIDGAQAVPHFGINVQEIDADFYTFSGHKVYAPTGIGILYGKKSLLEEMPPWQGGGNMIKQVTFENTTYNHLPHKFEAGTGNIADAIGLGTSIDYLQKIGLANIERHEHELTSYASAALARIKGLHLIGTTPHKTSVISFIIDDISPEKLAHHLDQEGIAIRIGHHCAQPLLHHFGLTSTMRVSLGLYNTKAEIDTLVKTIQHALTHCQ